MIIEQLNTELEAISQQLNSLTVEIINHRSGGSGFIWSADGLVVTNAHVVHGSKVKVKLDETIVEGLVIARDEGQDLAVIQTEANNLPTPAIRDSDLRSGEIVLAIGSPWGFKGTLTIGTIHANYYQNLSQNLGLNQYRQANRVSTVIVADIQLAPGNSGGILADAAGRVIGINTAIYHGLALAIPTQQIQDFVTQV